MANIDIIQTHFPNLNIRKGGWEQRVHAHIHTHPKKFIRVTPEPVVFKYLIEIEPTESPDERDTRVAFEESEETTDEYDEAISEAENRTTDDMINNMIKSGCYDDITKLLNEQEPDPYWDNQTEWVQSTQDQFLDF